ncbi:MAG: glycosyltransferase family 2 protein [Candidatus Aureabacteria bacterium]|nr:glycosyltransferase family 2 protein [Candidatus Auribacterota bacterium]
MNEQKISVVIPLYNDAEIVEHCYRSVHSALEKSQETLFRDYELLFVDDGSSDSTLAILLPLCGRDPRVKVVELDRNYGQHAAYCAGFEAAGGDVIVTLDSDLQISPDAIPVLLDAIRQGHDLVSGVRIGRTDPFFKRTLPSRVFNMLVNHITGVRLRDWGCPTVAMRKPVAKACLRYGEMRRFLKPLAVRLARSVGEVDLPHQPRIGGRSGYGILDLFELALDFITNFSRRPFQKVSLLGTALFVVGMLAGLGYIALRFLSGVPLDSRTQALIVLAAGGGLQLMILGFLGEFIIRIYRRQNGRPLYTVRTVHAAKGE